MNINTSLAVLGGKLEILLIMVIPILGVILVLFTETLVNIFSRMPHRH